MLRLFQAAPDTIDLMSRRKQVTRVVVGILASRITGLIRVRVLAHFFGVSALGDVWTASIRGPNVVQNLLGEQALSAAFIPIYSRKLARSDDEASRFAGAIFSILILVVGCAAIAGIVFAAPIVSLLNPGLLRDAALVEAGIQEIDRFPLVVRCVRIFFPMTAVMVLSAWCLGILNSHQRFLLPYMAPVLFNSAIIAALAWAGWQWGGGERVLLYACYGALVGALLQFLLQLGVVIRLLGRVRWSLSTRVDGVRECIRRFGPAALGRSAAQISGYFDLFLASFLAVGSLAALAWAQSLYLLPVALFGLSVAAVELPAMSRADEEDRLDEASGRLEAAFRQMSFLTTATVVAYLVFGHLVVGALYRSGSFGALDNRVVYWVLAAYSLGLLATTTSRILQSVFFALGDTTRPARVAFIRLFFGAILGALFSLSLDRVLVGGEGARTLSLGALGLACGSAIAAWIELRLLLASLRSEIPELSLPWGESLRTTGIAAAASLPALGLWWYLSAWNALALAPVVLSVFGGAYLALARLAGIEEADVILSRFRRSAAGD